jgi:4-oxalomesaconate tautomerase
MKNVAVTGCPVPGDGVRCMLMRGGTSKGLYFLAADLPPDPADRDALLLAAMGSGHPMQVDGVGGGHPLAAKVAVVSPSRREDADVDYLFLQLGVGEPTITDRQNCGNIVAGVGPFAVERGLIAAGGESTTARIHMVNSRAVVTATFATPGGEVRYAGDTAIAGVPGTAAPILLRFADTAGSATGSLLPTGSVRDVIDGIVVSCVDNGMPVVVARAADIEHPTGHLEVEVELDTTVSPPRVLRAGVVRTARKLFDGTVYPAPIAR